MQNTIQLVGVESVLSGVSLVKAVCILLGGFSYLLYFIFGVVSRKHKEKESERFQIRTEKSINDLYTKYNTKSEQLSVLQGEHNTMTCLYNKQCKNFKSIKNNKRRGK